LFTHTSAVASDTIRITYAGPEGSVRQALDLTESFELGPSLEQAEIFVLNGITAIPVLALSSRGTGS